MINPLKALQSFQLELSRGNLKLQPGIIFPDLFLHSDMLGNNNFRLTYVQLENSIVTSFVNFVTCPPIENTACLQMGYAVPVEYRNQGRAKKAIEMALTEMKFGYQKAGVVAFYVEAIVEQGNKPSIRVAEQTISKTPLLIIDQFSNKRSLQYLRKMK
ncbi:hypothetical protein AQ505_12990 [Pedobacter sp. PACM 27299]|uniref:GNAT family N-acetyltransferase n=1 Tax=Pedobacter sp. PACM 27299 TaxID=1727164 RepID=UPI000706D33D|nr:GNAT family N-acetyltransferase [Pedobacter sp. PACM 27299]ALL06334.1 hypothetical protein AQ505_12990 [Pedobacter sp. PACM 27299]